MVSRKFVTALILLALFAVSVSTTAVCRRSYRGTPQCDEVSSGYGCDYDQHYHRGGRCCVKMPNYGNCGFGYRFNYGRHCCERNYALLAFVAANRRGGRRWG